MAHRYDLRIDQGTTFGLSIECQDQNANPVDLTGCTARAMIRYSYTDASPAAIFTASVDAANAAVNLSLSATQTAALTGVRALWDCELSYPDSSVQRLVEGKVTISPEVTK